MNIIGIDMWDCLKMLLFFSKITLVRPDFHYIKIALE